MPPIISKIELAIRTQIADELGLEGYGEAPLDANLAELGADSFDRMHLHLSLEDMFKIDFPWEEGEKMQTVGDIVAYLEGRSKVA